MKPPSFADRASSALAALRRGFTIFELLVAMAVTVVLLGLLFSITSGSLKNFRQIDEGVRLQADAIAALNIVATDLQSLAVDVRQFDVLESTSETVQGLNFAWLMGVAMLFDNPGTGLPQNFGEMRAFSYKVAYADPSGGTLPVYALYRTLLPGGMTRNDVLAAMLATPAKGLSDNYWASHATTSPDDYLVGNVARFDIAWTYESLGVGNIPGLETASAGANVRYRRDRVALGALGKPGKLVKATITLTLLPESAVRQLNGAEPSASLIAAKGRSFSRDVNFRMP